MGESYPHLFSPVRVGPFVLKNRIAVAPHGPLFAEAGLLTRKYVDYEIDRIKGGAGLLIMSFGVADPAAPSASGSIFDRLVATWRRENIPLFREIVAAARNHDCRVFFQFGESAHRIGKAPSAVPHVGSFFHWLQEMSEADITAMMDRFADCAEVLCEAGLDGIEMHGHGDLFSDFFSPAINRRQDRYGGSRENRVRFFLEAASTIRRVIGPERALGARLSVDDCLPGSLALEEGVAIAGLVAQAGLLDYLNIDTAIEPQALVQMISPMYAEQGYELYASDAVKAAVTDIPVFTVGRIVEPAFAEAVIAAGRADVVTMARAFIADPEWPRKAEAGRAADIRPCLGDNQECIGRINQGLPIQCTVNPAVGREGEWGLGKLRPAQLPRRLLVVGGGPAGMEAARIAALRGHAVTLCDRAGTLGGQVLLARQLPGRNDIGRFLPWLEKQIVDLGVEIRLDTPMTATQVVAEAADEVILATGSLWDRSGYTGLTFQEIRGWDGENVLSLTEALEPGRSIGDRVVVVDLIGFVQAPGLAELLAGTGRQVVLATPYPKLGSADLDVTHQTPFIQARLRAANVRILTDTAVLEIAGKRVQLAHTIDRSTTSLDADTVIVVGGRLPDRALAEQLRASSVPFHCIGDAEAPLNIGKAFRDAWNVGLAEPE